MQVSKKLRLSAVGAALALGLVACGGSGAGGSSSSSSNDAKPSDTTIGVAMPTQTSAPIPERPILVVDDDAKIVRLVRTYLERDGFSVVTAADGPAALDAIERHRPALVVLDLMLPELDGRAVIRAVRRDDTAAATPILVLSARGTTIDRIAGFEDGADDYLPKPFSPQELVLRVSAVLRRLAAPAVATGGVMSAGPLVLDRTAHRVTVAGAEVELTATEFKLLRTLLEREGRVQTRAQLLETVWQAQPDIQTRTVDMHVQRLRQKLGKAGECIETVRGAGYRFRRLERRRGGRRRA